MRLLYIASIDFYSKPNPSYHLMKSMIEDILNSGHEVHLIGISDSQIDRHIPDEFNRCKSFSYNLIKTHRVRKSAFIRRYLQGIIYSIKTKKYIKEYAKKIDLIFLQSSPTILFTILMCKKYAEGVKIIYNIQDMFPGSSIASGVMKQLWMQNFFYYLQRIAYSKVDCIVAISDDMKQKLIEQGVQPEKIKTILNWFDDSSVKEINWENNQFVKKYNLSPDNFYVQYAGTTGYVFDYRAFLYVAKELKKYEKIHFQIIASGSQYDAFCTEANNERLTNIYFYPLQSQEMVSDVYSACSICYIPLKIGVIGNSVPSKAGLLMACKRLVVNSVDEDSSYYREFNKNDIGVSVSNTNYQKSVEAILGLYHSSERVKEMGCKAYLYGRQKYSRSENMRKYLELFDQLAK